MADHQKVKQLNPPGGPSFLVKICFRQKNSIQGEICWLESDKTVRFRSFMELTLLMQEALEKDGMPKVEQLFRSWDDCKEDIRQKNAAADKLT